MSRSDTWQGEPRDLHEWLAVEESRACEALGRHMVSRGVDMQRTVRLTAVIEALRAVNDRPLSPRATLRTLAEGLRATIARLEPAADGEPCHRWAAAELSEARAFLADIDTIDDWLANG